MTAPSDRDIHRLFDGDLTDDEAAAVRPHPATASKLAMLRLTREAARSVSAATPDSAALWAQIAARMEGAVEPTRTGEAPSRPSLRVIEGARSRSEEAPRRLGSQGRRRGVAAIGAVAALAAAGILWFRPTDPEAVAYVEPPIPLPEPAATLAQTEVVSVDFGANVGTVFSVEGNEGERVAVVWLAEEPESPPAPEGEF